MSITSTRCSLPMSMPTRPTASTICAGRAASRRRIPIYLNRSTAERYRDAVRLLLRLAGGQRLSADPRQSSDRGRRKPRPSTGRAVRSRCRLLLQHGSIQSPAFGSAMPPIRPMSATFRPRAGGSSKTSISGSSTGCAIPRTRAISASATRCRGSSASSRSRAVITNMHSDLDYEVLRQTSAGHHSGL